MGMIGRIERWWRMHSSKPVPYTPGMTLRPGQSTEIKIPISQPIGPGLGPWEPTSPPKDPPTKSISGLVPGLTMERREYPFRCNACGELQPANTPLVWVPGSTRIGASRETVIEACRLNMYNGHFSGWCFLCAQKLGS